MWQYMQSAHDSSKQSAAENVLFAFDQALEAIGGPKALLKCLQLLRAKPVVCAFGERPMSLLALLQASPYFSILGMIFRNLLHLQLDHCEAATKYASLVMVF